MMVNDKMRTKTLWIKDEYLQLILLSDPDHEVAEAYGAWGEKKLYGKTYEGIIRSHFAIDEEGRLTDFRIKVKPLKTADFLLVSLGLDELS